MEYYSQNSEFKRGQIRSNLGLATVIESDNSRRTPSRAREASKVGLTILLTATVALGWASFFNLKFLPFAAGLAMIYVLCLIITPNESPKEL